MIKAARIGRAVFGPKKDILGTQFKCKKNQKPHRVFRTKKNACAEATLDTFCALVCARKGARFSREAVRDGASALWKAAIWRAPCALVCALPAACFGAMGPLPDRTSTSERPKSKVVHLVPRPSGGLVNKRKCRRVSGRNAPGVLADSSTVVQTVQQHSQPVVQKSRDSEQLGLTPFC